MDQDERQQAKQDLYDALQAFGAKHPDLEGGLLTRSVLVTEWALPVSGLALYRVTTGPDGNELQSWEVAGLLASTLAQVLAKDNSRPA